MATQTPIKSSIPVDLERRICEIKHPSHTGPPGDLEDQKKRWLVVGICLHSILSPALRKYVEPVVTNLYNSLKLSDQIDLQTYQGHLRTYGVGNIYLNYEPINNNKTTHGYRTVCYDYKVQNAVDLSKLFLQTSMVHYTAFNESCDSSALLGMIISIDKFPVNVQTASRNVRLAIRNPWAHCNFTEWDTVKFNLSLQTIEDFIYLLNLNRVEESQIIGELNKWRTNGTSFCQGTTTGLELVDNIRQEIQALVEYADVICKSGDIEFSRVQTELIEMGTKLSQNNERILKLENTVASQGKILLEYESLYDADIPEIERWKQNSKDFIKTDIFTDIFEIFEDKHCVLLSGVSGMGKTLIAQNLALQLCYEKGYRIVPCSNVKDIKKRFKDNIRQVFFIDDIFGKYTANIKYIENWMRIEDFVKYILAKGLSKVLATCRTEIFKQENVKKVIKSFQEPFDLTGNYSTEDKVKIARKYLKENDRLLTDIVIKKEFSPLMCFLFTQHDVFDVNEFLNSPYKMFSDEWDKLKIFDREKFCVLLLCVIYNGTIDETNFDVINNLEIEEEMKFKIIFDCCRLGRDTPLSAIKDKLDACVDTYFIKVNKEYKVIHDKMFDFLCNYFGKSLVAPILKFADDKLISERVQLESIQKAQGEFTIIISSTDEQKYLDRLKMDLENGKIHWCLNNVQMIYKEYREKLLDVMKDLDDDVKRRCIDTKDENGINAFIISCMRGYEELVDLFISVGADVDAQNGWFTPLTAACREGHLRTVEILFDKGSNINKTNINRETPIYTACFGGHYSLVKQLIDKHADMNLRNKYNRTPLYVSCLSGHESIAGLLIDEGANVCECSDSLIVASHGGYDKIVEKLILKEDCCINSVDLNGKTALFIACEEGYTRIVKLIIDNNADIFKVDNDGKTPLHAACYVGNNDIVRMLINKDADVNMLDVDLETPLHKACRKGSEDVIITLLDYGADINHPNRDAHTPIHLAKTEGKDKIGPNKDSNVTENKKDKLQKQDTTRNLIRNGWTPLYEACVQGDIETFKSLIKNRANVNMQTNFGEMPLVAACQQGHGFLIQMLLEERADINQALYCAVQKDCDRAVKILLYKGGDLGYKGVDGKSLIKLACEHGSIKAIKILSVKGADFTEIDVNGRTLIHVACNKNSVDLIQFLIDKGLDLGIPDKNGRFALFVSIDKGFYDLSKYLVQKKCPIAIPEEDTKTALISVFESGNKELSKLLVSNGYTDNLLHFNETMLYHAYKLGLYENVEILRRYGADIKKEYEYGYTPMILADIGGNDDLSENLHNQIYSNYLRSPCISNIRTGIVYISDREDNDTFKDVLIREKCDLETASSCRLEEYEDLFQACMYGNIKPPIRGMLPGMQINFFFKPTDPSVSIWFEQTPLCLAIRRGHTKVCKFLLRHGVNVNLTFEEWSTKNDVSLSMTIRYGYSPLFAACQRKYNDIVDMLIERGANLNKALYDACREGYLNTVQFLLQKGADVNSIGRYGHTALYGACIGGYSTIVKFLIDQGSVVDTQVQRTHILDEITCLHAAYLCGNHDIVQLLIKRGASVDTVDNFGRTLLHKASSDGNYKIVEILMDKGVDINASELCCSTPLIACLLENIEDNHEENYFDRHMGKYNLYEYFGQIHEDYPDHLYEHCDHFGSKYKLLTENHYKVIQLLIENGADINKADKKDRTPLSLAKKIGDVKLTEMLLPKELLPIVENNLQGRNQVCRKRRRRNSKKKVNINKMKLNRIGRFFV
ncbi:unnamed protein product [Mytilus coruscus]|uniref:Novel STAND NTPase 3 domain-containing protein n=1 Tax=Mytilus coruscus TaxID=42192 RepID=A0A6J8DPY6_MYTCO|nr:unnamed protein product [Mytilus coruscus]